MSGKFKGRKLKPPSDYKIRPTLDNVKESIFNVLGSRIEGANVLDLFSGTGSLGIESLSRNCSIAYFVDKSFESIELISYNINCLKIEDEKYKIIRSDVVDFLRSYAGFKWDIIFIDPPYKIESGIMREIFDILSEKKITGTDTLIIYEYFFKKDIEKETENLKKIKKSHFGDKQVVYLSPY
ncbi:MAG TPA: 16S rRNA (guanine(966)-N(2))-methyltransferase RsmD [Candidatus Humimicrobiaceae bacterium]|nr:16S rRNA (guanine(966)-N(2))-methyltransferase RsmD [Candidatus Humimicrobiaceae bacterium]